MSGLTHGAEGKEYMKPISKQLKLDKSRYALHENCIQHGRYEQYRRRRRAQKKNGNSTNRRNLQHMATAFGADAHVAIVDKVVANAPGDWGGWGDSEVFEHARLARKFKVPLASIKKMEMDLENEARGRGNIGGSGF
jgi:hypothetical protein